MEALVGAAPTSSSRTNTHTPAPIFPVRVSEKYGTDVAPLGNDIVRMICIQLAIQVMLALSDSNRVGSIFTTEFLLLIVYIILGAMLYWLAIRHVITFY